MRQELSALLDLGARGGSPAAQALVAACVEFCFRAEVANDDPATRLSPGEVDTFLGLMAQLRPPA